jgi:hypothetical protein
VFTVTVEAMEQDAYRRLAKGLRNPRRVRDVALRLSFLTLSVVLAYPVAFVFANLHVYAVLLTYALVVLTTALLYLLACDPLAPRRGLLQTWLADSTSRA